MDGERINLITEHAKEKGKCPAEWRPCKWKCFPENSQETIYMEITGAIYPHVFKSGPRKGKTNYSKPLDGTQKTVIVTIESHTAWVKAWVAKTGNCSECVGTGKTLKSVGIHGTEWRECRVCKGTGKGGV